MHEENGTLRVIYKTIKKCCLSVYCTEFSITPVGNLLRYGLNSVSISSVSAEMYANYSAIDKKNIIITALTGHILTESAVMGDIRRERRRTSDVYMRTGELYTFYIYFSADAMDSITLQRTLDKPSRTAQL